MKASKIVKIAVWTCGLFQNRLEKKEGMNMVESRCGLLCSSCEFREQMNCPSCTQMEKPFWGDSCPVKSCCEEKKLEHCGLCSEFPCALLHQFAYDMEQSDNGQRIEQCKQWKNGT